MKGTATMKIYDIFDQENDISVGTLIYYEKSSACIIELSDKLDKWTAPLLFTHCVENKIYTILQEESLLWVKERVIPSGRQNIGSILSHHRLKEYDEMKLLELSKGECSQDSLCIKALDELPDYVKKRAMGNVTDCVILDDGFLLCFFADDSIRKIDLHDIKDLEGVDKVLNNQLLFNSGKVGVGGYSVTFNDSIEISARVLYKAGVEIPLRKSDFDSFVTQTILDTTASCECLGCSRQNLAYLVNEEKLVPIKENVRGNLYQKGDVLKSVW